MTAPTEWQYHLPLLLQLIRRDVAERYRGSLLGLSWSFLTPLFMLAVYTLVFSSVFKVKWGIDIGNAGTGTFALMLFAGLIIHGLFAEVASSAPDLVLANPSYVKKVVFPLHILPMVAVGAALFHALASIGVLFIFELLVLGRIPPTALLLPVVLAPFIPLLLGIGWLLASLGVFLRDIRQIVGPVISAMLFLSPVFFPLQAAPEALRPFLMLNPLTLIIVNMRKALIYGQWPDFGQLALYGVFTGLFAMAALWWFHKTRDGFADVL